MTSCHKDSVERILDRHALGSPWRAAADEAAERAAKERQEQRQLKTQLAREQRAALDRQVQAKLATAGNEAEESKKFLEQVLIREATEAEMDKKRRLAAREKEMRDVLEFERRRAAELAAKAAIQKKLETEMRVAAERAAREEAIPVRKLRNTQSRCATTEPDTSRQVPDDRRRCRSSAEQEVPAPSVGILPNIVERPTAHSLGSVSPPPEVLARIQRQQAVMTRLPAFASHRATELATDGYPLPYEDDAARLAKRAREKEKQEKTRSILETQVLMKQEMERQRREREKSDVSAVQADGCKIANALDRKHQLAAAELKKSLRLVLDEQMRYSRIVRKAHDVTPKI